MTHGRPVMDKNNKIRVTTLCNNLKITFQGSSDFPRLYFQDLRPLLFSAIFLRTSLCSLGNYFTLYQLQSISSHYLKYKHPQFFAPLVSTFLPSWYLITCGLALELGDNFTPSGNMVLSREYYLSISNCILCEDKLHIYFVSEKLSKTWI